MAKTQASKPAQTLVGAKVQAGTVFLVATTLICGLALIGSFGAAIASNLIVPARRTAIPKAKQIVFSQPVCADGECTVNVPVGPSTAYEDGYVFPGQCLAGFGPFGDCLAAEEPGQKVTDKTNIYAGHKRISEFATSTVSDYHLAFFDFNTSIIPDKAVITSVSFNGYLNTVKNTKVNNNTFYRLSGKSFGRDVSQIWSDMGGCYVSTNPDSWISPENDCYLMQSTGLTARTGVYASVNLGPLAANDLQRLLVQNYFSLGIRGADNSLNTFVSLAASESANKPYLTVKYRVTTPVLKIEAMPMPYTSSVTYNSSTIFLVSTGLANMSMGQSGAGFLHLKLTAENADINIKDINICIGNGEVYNAAVGDWHAIQKITINDEEVFPPEPLTSAFFPTSECTRLAISDYNPLIIKKGSSKRIHVDTLFAYVGEGSKSDSSLKIRVQDITGVDAAGTRSTNQYIGDNSVTMMIHAGGPMVSLVATKTPVNAKGGVVDLMDFSLEYRGVCGSNYVLVNGITFQISKTLGAQINNLRLVQKNPDGTENQLSAPINPGSSDLFTLRNIFLRLNCSTRYPDIALRADVSWVSGTHLTVKLLGDNSFPVPMPATYKQIKELSNFVWSDLSQSNGDADDKNMLTKRQWSNGLSVLFLPLECTIDVP